ncbi:MAG: hypothetical protein B6D39_08225 [Anaerolineae bacterium UTCFX2]|jgi:molybdenum cofactor cytidylyltransferase|nr:putative selenium-dependent hydroxylase accessory protein YqeC [Anaerolineae bacterium]OQY90519.1 MAG: hypothetical protein B6D39_08225 [Anaerolineae bacterium UTCFX2]
MHLIDALRLDHRARAALVGAGGKSAALFQLAREFTKPVIKSDRELVRAELNAPAAVCLTTTTHLGIDQANFADRHFILEGDHLPSFASEIDTPGVFLVTGTRSKQDRFGGLSMQAVGRLAQTIGPRIPLLIEADGSRQRPLKAPASHEPAIPEWVDLVAVVAGLSGLGKPLTDEWVHRPELFGALAGLEPGALIGVTHLERVLSHPEGGLKNIPNSARRILILNQAQTDELKSAAKSLSVSLLDFYEAVVIANLPAAIDSVEFPAPEAVIAVHERVAGVILAAGASRRFGKLKQTLEWQGKPFVRLAAETALAGGLRPVIVVVGNAATEVQNALNGLPVEVVYNAAWETGQSSSIKAGLGAVPGGTGAAMFLPVDKPRLPVSLLRSLVELHSLELAPIVAPLVNGRRSNPVLFDRDMFEFLTTITGDIGGRELFSRFTPTWLPWNDPYDLQDIDTPADYAALLNSHREVED